MNGFKLLAWIDSQHNKQGLTYPQYGSTCWGLHQPSTTSLCPGAHHRVCDDIYIYVYGHVADYATNNKKRTVVS